MTQIDYDKIVKEAAQYWDKCPLLYSTDIVKFINERWKFIVDRKWVFDNVLPYRKRYKQNNSE